MNVRMVFMGSDPIALPMLDVLIEQDSLEIAGVFTQPDKKTGRGMQLRANAIKQWAQSKDIPVYQPVKCGPAEVELLNEIQVDLIVVMAYGQILREDLLSFPRLGVVNLHASLLPELRGASPIHTALAEGFDKTGISLMQIVRKLDAGPVADVEIVEISKAMQISELCEQMGKACIPLMLRNLSGLMNGNLEFKEQDTSKVSYCRIIEKADGHLDFGASAKSLERRMRAFDPWPGSFAHHNGNMIRFFDAVAIEDNSGQPGEVTKVTPDCIVIACGQGSLLVKMLQRAGGKILPVDAFIRGYQLGIKDKFSSGSTLPLVFEAPYKRKRK